MWGKLIVSQIFSVAAGYVASEIYKSIFSTPTPFIIPLATWLVTSLIVIIKL